MKRSIFSFVISSLLVVGAPVHAAPSPADKELAKTLYQQAAADMERGAYDRACPQFEAALKLDPEHIRTAMTLGMCEDHWGRLVQAQSHFDYARALAVAQAATEKVTEIDALLADLKPRIPKLRIVVPDKLAEARDLSILRNGTSVARDAWGKDVAVDPGAQTIEASIPRRGVWRTTVRIESGQTAAVTIVLAEGISSSSKDGPEARPIGRTLGFIGIGLGGASLLTGGVLGGLAISKNNASNDGHCRPDDYCDALGAALRLDAIAYGNASTALFIVGGVLATGGIVLVATSPAQRTPTVATNPFRMRIGVGQVQLETLW